MLKLLLKKLWRFRIYDTAVCWIYAPAGWILGFCRYMSCFVAANIILSVWVYLWLRKKGVVRFSTL